MKPFLAFCALLLACAAPAAAQDAAPELAQRLNGRAAGGEPLALERGEPLIVEVQLRHPSRRAKEALLLEPPNGGWSQRVKIAVKDETGAPAPWPFSVTGKPSAGGLALRPGTVTTLVLRLDTAAGTAPSPGRYSIAARLELPDGGGFRGTAESPLGIVEVVEPGVAPVGAALGRRYLLRVQDALLRGDLTGAAAAAAAALRAEPGRPEGFVSLALVHEARGERGLAILLAEIAVSRAMDLPAQDAGRDDDRDSPGRLHPPGEHVPLEYLELIRRLENAQPLPAGDSR